MALGLASKGHAAVAVGHIESDMELIEAAIARQPWANRLLPMIADIRSPESCDDVIDAAVRRFGNIDE